MKIIQAGGYISFSGIVTFPSAQNIQQAATHIPLNAMLCETDSPYLTPVPKRGTQNIPENVKLVYKKERSLNI